MNIDDFIKELKSIRRDLRKKELKIQAPNGIMFEPRVKVVLKNEYDALNFSAKNVDYLIITIEA